MQNVFGLRVRMWKRESRRLFGSFWTQGSVVAGGGIQERVLSEAFLVRDSEAQDREEWSSLEPRLQ